MYKLVLASKLLLDPKPTIYFYQMFSSLLSNIGYAKEAY